MAVSRKSKKALIEENKALRSRLEELERSQAEHRELENALRESEARLRTVIESLPFDFFLIDETGRYAMLNKVCKQNWGDVVGKRPEDICPDEKTLALWQNNNRRAFAGEVVEEEVVLKPQAGEGYYHNIISPIRDGDEIKGILGVNIDITQYKKVQTALEETTGLLETIFDTTHIMIAYLDPEFNFIRVNKAYALADEKEPSFFPGKNHFALYPNAENEAIFRRVVETGEPYFANAKPFEYAEYPERGVSYWDWSLIPIKNRRESVTGLVLSLVNVTERELAEEALKAEKEFIETALNAQQDTFFVFEPSTGKAIRWNKAFNEVSGFSDEEIHSMKAPDSYYNGEDLKKAAATTEKIRNEGIATVELSFITRDGEAIPTEYTASAINDNEGNLRYIIAIGRDITERKKAEEALRESEGKLQAMLRSLTDHMSMMDEDLNIIWANETAKNIFGDDIVGMKCYKAYHRRNKPCEPYPCLTLKVFQDGKVHEHDTQVVSKDGNIKYFHCSANVALRDEGGNPTAVLEISEDITNQKLAEEALRESENSYRAVVENALEGIVVVQDQTLQFVNPALVSMLGYPEKELLTRPFIEFIHPDHREWAMGIHIKRLKGEEVPAAYEFKVLDKKGNVKWLENSGILIEWRGRPATLNFLRDVTEQKQTEEELRIKENAIASSINAIVIAEFGGNLTYANKAFIRMWGYDDESEVLGRGAVEFWQSKEKAQEVIGALQHGESVIGELVARRKDGSLFDVQLSACVVTDESGAPVYMMGSLLDITEQKKAEEALRESENKYKAVVDNAIEGIVVVQDGMLKFVNPHLVSVMGYSVEELMSRPFIEFIHPDDKERVRGIHMKRLKGEEVPTIYEFKIFDKDGNTVWVENNGILIEWGGRPATLNFLRDISERKKAEQAVWASESEKRSILNAISDYILFHGTDLAIRWGNDAAAKSIGKTQQELVGLHCYELWQGRSEPCEGCPVLRAIKTDSCTAGIMTTPDGKWWEIIGEPVRDRDGKVRGAIEISRDITERKKAEENLKYRIEFEQLITMLSKSFIDPGDIHEKINGALKTIGEFAEVDRAYVFQLSEDGRTAENTHEWCAEGIKPQIDNLKRIALDEELPWFWGKMKAHEPFHVPAVADLAPEAELEKRHFEEHEIQALTVVPMLSKGILKGFLGFDSVRSEKTWPEDIITLLRISGESVSMALDRERAEQRARLLSSTVEQSTEGVAVADLEGNLLFLNNAFAVMHGYTPEELLGKSLLVFHTSEQMPSVEAANRQIKETGEFNGEIWHVRRDGTVFPSMMHNSLLRNEEGEPIGMIGTLRDVTESKKAEQALKESEIMFRSLTEDSLVGVYLIQDGMFKYVNPKFAETFGYTPDELIGTKGPDKIVFSEDWPISKENLRRRLEGEIKSIQYSYRGVTKDNKVIYVEVYGSATQYQGRPAVIGTLLDITERKQAEEKLKQYRFMVESAYDPIFFKDLESRYIIANNKTLEAFGLSREQVIGKNDYEIMPERKEARKNVEDDKLVFKTGKLREITKRMTGSDGKKRWFQAIKAPQFDDKGEIIGLVGIARDITDRKKVEEKLLEYQEQLKSLASQLSLIEERERRHIATELHDQISQSLVISKIKLDSLRQSLSPGESKKVLKEVGDYLAKVIQDTRTLTFDLSSPILYELGFEAAVAEWLEEQIGRKHGIETEFEDDEQEKPLDEDIRALLFRNVRELLINVVKHANAKKVKVSIRKLNNDIRVRVEDDGVGFEVTQLESLVTQKAKFGLFSIRERLESLGGRFEIKSKLGRGSKITMKAPLKEQKTTNGAQV